MEILRSFFAFIEGIAQPGIFVALALDSLTTIYAIRRYGIEVESNPIIVALFKRWKWMGFAAYDVFLVGCFVCIVLFYPEMADICFLVFSLAVLNNCFQIGRGLLLERRLANSD